MEGRQLVGSGRDADVFRLGPDRVLRRYRDGGDATREAEIMAYVGDRGYPVPAVYDVDGPDLVMELLDGPTMADALWDGSLETSAGARVLADLSNRLHAVPARPGSRDGDRVIHLDLHPYNVMLASRGPVVIDWRNAGDGPADLDVALSAVILAQVALDDDNSEGPAAVVREFLAHFLAHVTDDPLRLLDEAVARRDVDANATVAERERLPHVAALVRDLARSGPT
jgi:tRNA A-37 threonylcarbamoyl transferase component Bud32